MKVYFVGAGPGAADLITIRGKRLIEEADVVIYAGSLVNPDLLRFARSDARKLDSSGMDLTAVLSVYSVHAKRSGSIVRLHTGDPSVYGAIQEQIDFCIASGIPWEVVPGVSSVGAAAAAVGRELTLPGISQTLVVTRVAGRTPMPEREDLSSLAQPRASMALLLSVQQIDRVCEKLSDGYPADTPVVVVYRASWPDEQVVRGTLETIADAVKAAGITRQAVVLVGKAIDAGPDEYSRSKLYDASFSHGYRSASDGKASG